MILVWVENIDNEYKGFLNLSIEKKQNLETYFFHDFQKAFNFLNHNEKPMLLVVAGSVGRELTDLLNSS